MKAFKFYAVIIMNCLLLTGCVTVGSKFAIDYPKSIQIGITTQNEIEKELGAPYRTGLDSGDPSATYLYYHVGLFTRPKTTDLTIVYDDKGIVQSYVFNTNEEVIPEEDE